MNAVTIDFNKMDGLVPGIVQDATTGEMLMLGFLNEESYRKTLESGFVTFWSRTRSKLWMKGETSGNRLHRLRQRRTPLQGARGRRRPGMPRRHRKLLHQRSGTQQVARSSYFLQSAIPQRSEGICF
jgi:hypothetical protein